MKTTYFEKQNDKTTYEGTWSGLAGGTENQLSDPIGYVNASGNLTDPGSTMADSAGSSAVPLVAGVDYVYDQLLSSGTYDIYDDSASGAFASGKVMRVVENSKNVTDATGLNLSVRAKNLSTIISPPSTEIYVDPNTGKFVLPRPIYWSDCANDAAFKTEAKISSGTITTAGEWYYGAGSVAFGKGYGTNVQYDYGAYGSYTVTGIPGMAVDLSKFTCSFHASVGAGYHNSGTYTTFGFGIAIGDVYIGIIPSNAYHASTHYIDVYVHGPHEGRYGPYADGVVQHIYVVGDSSAGLSGSKTVKVYLDGSLLHQSTAVFNSTSATMSITTNGACYWNHVGAHSLIGNVKLYNSAIDQTPTWISATEDALHHIYGATNGYKPSNVDIGCYYIAPSTSPAKVTQANAATSIMKWSD